MSFIHNPCGEVLPNDYYERMTRHRIFYNGRSVIVVIGAGGRRYVDMYCGVSGLSLSAKELLELRPLRETIDLYTNHDGYAGMSIEEFIKRMSDDSRG